MNKPTGLRALVLSGQTWSHPVICRDSSFSPTRFDGFKSTRGIVLLTASALGGIASIWLLATRRFVLARPAAALAPSQYCGVGGPPGIRGSSKTLPTSTNTRLPTRSCGRWWSPWPSPQFWSSRRSCGFTGSPRSAPWERERSDRIPPRPFSNPEPRELRATAVQDPAGSARIAFI